MAELILQSWVLDQSIAVKRELEIPEDKLNVNGGAIALGHPVGASGCCILVTLIHAMKERKAKTGLVTFVSVAVWGVVQLLGG